MGRFSSLYQRHPKMWWWIILLVGLVFVLGQSWLAQPRDGLAMAYDALVPVLVVVPVLLATLYISKRTLIVLGLFYILLLSITCVTDWFPRQYGTFLFLVASFFIVDGYNVSRHRVSLFADLMGGNAKLAAGVLLSTYVFGLVTEIINVPFGIWSYHIPLPSLHWFVIPPLMAAFGWTPWTLAILAIFYPFVVVGRPDEDLGHR